MSLGFGPLQIELQLVGVHAAQRIRADGHYCLLTQPQQRCHLVDAVVRVF